MREERGEPGGQSVALPQVSQASHKLATGADFLENRNIHSPMHEHDAQHRAECRGRGGSPEKPAGARRGAPGPEPRGRRPNVGTGCRLLGDLRILSGAEFNALLERDPELRRLENLRPDPALDMRLFMEIANLGDFRIGKLPVRPLTAAKWSFLYLLGSPFVRGGKIVGSDLDLMLGILSCESLAELNCELPDLPGMFSGFSRATGLSAPAAADEIDGMIRTALEPLSMLPEDAPRSGEPCYDGVWLAMIAGIAARESGMELEYCMHRMSLSCCSALYVNHLRSEIDDPGRIRRRVPEDIAQKISARVDELADAFLAEKKGK